MITLFLILIPFVFGLVSFFIKNKNIQKIIILGVAIVHLILVILVWNFFDNKDLISLFNGWFDIDSIGLIFLTIMSILFLGVAFYGLEALFLGHSNTFDNQSNKIFSHESIFSGCLILFLATMTTAIMCQHLALIWVAIEATTLATAPLIYFHKTKGSLEATWKYLLICSVGIAIALLGLFFVAKANTANSELLLKNLLNSNNLNIQWLKVGFLLIFVGYGTKMGLAPLHTWLPDAHSEAPSKVSALLSGTLLNCAFLGIIRVYEVCIKANLGSYCQEIFIVFGILSLFFASIFIIVQKDYKRMLAYSSIEHMGILILGLGLGGAATMGALINTFAHSLTKAALFLTAGNILLYYKTKNIENISGIIRTNPYTGFLWLLGFILITGTPPSAIFRAKFMILKEAIYTNNYLIAILFLLPLVIIFIGMARIFIFMTQGEKIQNFDTNHKNSFFRIIIPLTFFSMVIILGIFLPEWLNNILISAASSLGG